MMILKYMLSVAVAVFLLTSMSDAFADQTTLKSSSGKLIFYKEVSVFGSQQEVKKSLEFHLYNVGNVTARDVSIFPSELNLVEASRSSQYVTQLGVNLLSFDSADIDNTRSDVLERNVLSIKNGTQSTVLLNLEKVYVTSGKYNGSILVMGANFEPLTIDLELIARHNTLELVAFTFFGMVIATFLGLWYRVSDEEKSLRSKTGNSAILSHINGHTFNLNQIRDTIDPLIWRRIQRIHQQKRKKLLDVVKMGGKLDSDAEAVKWYEEKVKELVKKQFSEQPIPQGVRNNKLKEISKNDRKVRGRTVFKADLIRAPNIVFAFIAAAVSIPTMLAVTSQFLGHPIVDVFIAMGIGFVIYRTKDIGKLISNIKGSLEKK